MRIFEIVSRDRHTMRIRFSDYLIEQIWHPDWGNEIWTEQEAKDHEANGTSYVFEMQVCDRCGGTSKIVHPGVDSHGISSSEFSEDPEFASDYFSGDYDITCPTCNGQNVVPVVVIPDAIQAVINEGY